jgi:hypothetical protein
MDALHGDLRVLQSVTCGIFIGAKTVSDKEVGENNETHTYMSNTQFP